MYSTIYTATQYKTHAAVMIHFPLVQYCKVFAITRIDGTTPVNSCFEAYTIIMMITRDNAEARIDQPETLDYGNAVQTVLAVW